VFIEPFFSFAKVGTQCKQSVLLVASQPSSNGPGQNQDNPKVFHQTRRKDGEVAQLINMKRLVQRNSYQKG